MYRIRHEGHGNIAYQIARPYLPDTLVELIKRERFIRYWCIWQAGRLLYRVNRSLTFRRISGENMDMSCAFLNGTFSYGKSNTRCSSCQEDSAPTAQFA